LLLDSATDALKLM